MTTLHHLNASRSDRIFWLFEELSIPYDVVVHWRTARGLAPESLKQVFPLGKVSVVVMGLLSRYSADGEAPVVVEDGTPLAESGAIVHYYYSRHAANKAGASLEAQTSQYSTYWSHFAEGSLMLQLQPAFVASKIREGISAVKVTYILPFFQKGAATFYEHFAGVAEGNIKTYLAYTEKFLGEHGNFSGDKDVIGEGDVSHRRPRWFVTQTAASRK
jgi:glutathione S-transferase